MGSAHYYLIPAAVAAYYFCVWIMLPRRPREERAVVRYEPPRGLTPAAARYLATMGCDSHTFIAILAQLQALGVISIAAAKEQDTILLSKLRSDHRLLQRLCEEERIVMKATFEWKEEAVELTRPDQYLMEKIRKSLQAHVKPYVTRNLIYIVIAVLISSAGTAWMCQSLQFFGEEGLEPYFLSIFTGLTVGAFISASTYVWDQNFQAIRLALKGLYHRRALPVLFLLILIYPALWFLLMRTVNVVFANVTTLLMAVNMFAAPFLRSYTSAGSELMNELLGFRQFLERVEKDRLQRLNAIDESGQAEREYLAYAIALDVREDWGDRLAAKVMVETAL